MDNRTRLEKKLRAIAPGSTVTLSWTTDDHTTDTTGTITSYDPTTAFRHLKTSNRDLLLTAAGTEIAVSEITATGTTELGTLTSIRCDEHPTETLRITDAGIDVPPYLVGYSGLLLIDWGYKTQSCIIPAPGLQRYDARLLAELDIRSPERYRERVIGIQPSPGPERKFKTVDERTTDATSEPTREQQRYGDLERVIATVRELSETVFVDERLDPELATRLERKLFSLQTRLVDAHHALFEPAPSESPLEADETDPYSWTSYRDALEWVDTQMETLQDLVEADETFPRQRRNTATFALSWASQPKELLQTLGEHHVQPTAKRTRSTSDASPKR